MSERDVSLERLVAERDRLRGRVLELEHQGVVIASGIAALQNSGNRRTDDTGFCPGGRL